MGLNRLSSTKINTGLRVVRVSRCFLFIFLVCGSGWVGAKDKEELFGKVVGCGK